jgi:hypothetical protein
MNTMSDDVVGVIPDDNLDDETQGFGPTSDDLTDDTDADLAVIDDLDVLADDAEHPLEDDGFLFEDDELLGQKKKKKSEVAVEDEELVGVGIIEEEIEEDDDEDFFGDEDDEARYNYRAEEDLLDEGF